MNTQTLTKPATNYNFFVISDEGFTPAQPICASSRDYGFDFDQEELARELLAPLPTGLSTQTIPEVETDEFEKKFRYFLS
jgi:hypothetical protein